MLDSEGWVIEEITSDTKEGFRLKKPSKLAVTPDGNVLVVLHSENNNLIKIDLVGSEAPIVFGQSGKKEGQFLKPVDLALDEFGNIYVLDAKTHRISVFSAKGDLSFSFAQKGKQENEFRKPSLLAVTPDGKNAFILDGYEIKKFALDHGSKTATHISNAGGKGKGPRQLLKPIGLACDRLGLLYVTDSLRKDLQVIDYRGKNAITVYSNSYKDWGFKELTHMMLNVDGRPYLIDSEKVVGFNWKTN